MLESLLQSAGHNVLTSANGVEASEILTAGGFGLAVVDIAMPGGVGPWGPLQGRDTIETIIDIHHHHPDVKIVALSKAADECADLLKAAVTVGANAAFATPFDGRKLLGAVERLLG